MSDFFIVFAICFPAFTGMTAGVGLSGDLKNPARSIPVGTLVATVTGMVVYIGVIYKLTISASPEDMLENQLIMSKIAIGGVFIVPLGLAASTLSSALGSVMVAPRTLQALANDASFPSMRLNRWLASARSKDGEPVNATLVTLIIAIIFVSVGSRERSSRDNINVLPGDIRITLPDILSESFRFFSLLQTLVQITVVPVTDRLSGIRDGDVQNQYPLCPDGSFAD